MKNAPLILSLVLLGALPVSAQAGDRDRDRLPDRWEKRHKTGVKTSSARRDLDRDGLSNLDELRAGTNPRSADSDHDRVADDDEDADRDRVDNASEIAEGTLPRRSDSDRDGKGDGREDSDRDGLSNAAEDQTGHDPTNRDTDRDGVRDGKELAGTVLSFKNGLLTVSLAGGAKVSGAVAGNTVIECLTEDSVEAGHKRGRKSRKSRRRGGRSAAQVSQSEDDPVEEEDEGPGSNDPDDDVDPGPDPEGEQDPEDGEGFNDDVFDNNFDKEFEGEGDGQGGSGGQGGQGGKGGSGAKPCSSDKLRRGARVNELKLRTSPNGTTVASIRLLF